MKALVLGCTLKASGEMVRVTAFHVAPGVKTDEGGGDQWPQLGWTPCSAKRGDDGLPVAYWNRGPGPGKNAAERRQSLVS